MSGRGRAQIDTARYGSRPSQRAYVAPYGFIVVEPTGDELSRYYARHPGESFPTGPSVRLLRHRCGARIWGSGFGITAHRNACTASGPTIGQISGQVPPDPRDMELDPTEPRGALRLPNGSRVYPKDARAALWWREVRGAQSVRLLLGIQEATR